MNMLYDYECQKCGLVFEIEKSIVDPAPSNCPRCMGNRVERHFSPADVPTVLYPNRPPWTYNDAKRYKNARWCGGPLTKIDPSKHGDLGAWNSPGEVIPEKKKKKK